MDHEYFFAGSREKGEESSAWLARLGAPARLGDREGCSMIRTGYPPCGRGQGEVHTGDARRNRRAGAPKRAIHALPSPSDGIRRASREDREIHTGDARRNRRAGAPKRAIHALPSPLFSLFSTSYILSSVSIVRVWSPSPMIWRTIWQSATLAVLSLWSGAFLTGHFR